VEHREGEDERGRHGGDDADDDTECDREPLDQHDRLIGICLLGLDVRR